MTPQANGSAQRPFARHVVTSGHDGRFVTPRKVSRTAPLMTGPLIATSQAMLAAAIACLESAQQHAIRPEELDPPAPARPYRLLVDTMQEGAATVAGGIVRYANRRLADWCRYRRRGSSGRRCSLSSRRKASAR